MTDQNDFYKQLKTSLKEDYPHLSIDEIKALFNETIPLEADDLIEEREKAFTIILKREQEKCRHIDEQIMHHQSALANEKEKFIHLIEKLSLCYAVLEQLSKPPYQDNSQEKIQLEERINIFNNYIDLYKERFHRQEEIIKNLKQTRLYIDEHIAQLEQEIFNNLAACGGARKI